MFPEANKCKLYSTNSYENYRYNCEGTMTKTIATRIRNINKTFIDISMGIPLGYIIIIIVAMANTQ